MKKAFTLAEVLITLGIIGVVAAITIPTLVSNYKTRAWNTASSVFERKIEEALKVMNTQQTLVGYKNTKDFLNEFSKHMKITRICDTVTDCMEEKVTFNDKEVEMSKIKTAKDFGQDDWDTEILGVQFANGTVGAIAYNPTTTCKQDPYSNRVTGSSCIALLYDTSGLQSPNTSGKDLRGIQVNKLGASCGAFEVAGTCYGAPFVPTPMTGRECEREKEALGIDACRFNRDDHLADDSWAGAVKQCGGIKNMPTDAQLAQIASEIYGVPIRATQDVLLNVTRNDALASSYGFDILSHSFSVWSRYEDRTDHNFAHARAFTPGTTIWNRSYRSNDFQAVCIVD